MRACHAVCEAACRSRECRACLTSLLGGTTRLLVTRPVDARCPPCFSRCVCARCTHVRQDVYRYTRAPSSLHSQAPYPHPGPQALLAQACKGNALLSLLLVSLTVKRQSQEDGGHKGQTVRSETVAPPCVRVPCTAQLQPLLRRCTRRCSAASRPGADTAQASTNQQLSLYRALIEP